MRVASSRCAAPWCRADVVGVCAAGAAGKESFRAELRDASAAMSSNRTAWKVDEDASLERYCRRLGLSKAGSAWVVRDSSGVSTAAVTSAAAAAPSDAAPRKRSRAAASGTPSSESDVGCAGGDCARQADLAALEGAHRLYFLGGVVPTAGVLWGAGARFVAFLGVTWIRDWRLSL